MHMFSLLTLIYTFNNIAVTVVVGITITRSERTNETPELLNRNQDIIRNTVQQCKKVYGQRLIHVHDSYVKG